MTKESVRESQWNHEVEIIKRGGRQKSEQRRKNNKGKKNVVLINV